MRRAIATVCLSGTLEEKLEAIASARFDAVEIFENDFNTYHGSAHDVRRICDELGLVIDLYQPFRDFEGASDAQFRRNLDRVERKFDVMEALGATMLLVCSSCAPDAIADDARSTAQLYALAERAAKRNISIGFEALAWARHVRHYEHAWKLVREADHPHLGILLDSFHILSLGDDPAAIRDIPGDKIAFVQLADAPVKDMDVLQWSRHYRCFPGQGQLDLPNFLEQILLAGYTGPLSLEIFNDHFRAAPARPTAIDAYRSLLYLEEAVAHRLADTTDDAALDARRKATADHLELFKPPALPALDGLAFIEFAVDANSERALARVLDMLGFRRAGKHRSKAVTLFRQGDIDIILNAEPGSFAHTHFLRHGPSICALGIATEQSLRALNRATAYGCPRFEGRIGPNELKIPAIRAPDDSLIYFVPSSQGSKRLYEIDFLLEDELTAEATQDGLRSIDHIAQGLPRLRHDAWTLFYRTVLGAEPGESMDLIDPYGLISTRSVSTHDRKLRFVLNVSESDYTHTARTMTQLAGASVHHISFTCSDIFATVEALRQRGVRFIAVSPNYYLDLPTRFELADDLVARLQSLGILYDRTPEGEYFHVFTDVFAERFYFEVVQRVDHYDGYGAANAPARMVAHMSALK
ncbi:sugar phosphate isomerase/epimerase and 4-hydroxyphenylpyruvate domain-containing protein [Azoarcus sp. L1K30]|uniref:bifunctional sugar phosphate isomerase/epimerase/4-hydroxyphenylpyruvate dioxygenase family protein n=1 Tax=Azoarcus sp. L1K30 TaxID=2820277 RepID=UPI001B82BF14|nr:sugar phosphate isomerase/epimerase and 4-hydroxyphenylpyruvate domain-containing protein [Azoarcus sp. L1K30]MBR0564739.1 sugar phosphate isomerase/epimerase and 4-hydroxyphenylpyruvate domain-containing protein [Azoarcus sp. L1K30]